MSHIDGGIIRRHVCKLRLLSVSFQIETVTLQLPGNEVLVEVGGFQAELFMLAVSSHSRQNQSTDTLRVFGLENLFEQGNTSASVSQASVEKLSPCKLSWQRLAACRSNPPQAFH